jgi:hypothetical protein
MESSKLCPICGRLMDKNSYFKRWICNNKSCNYIENIKSRDENRTIEELINVINELLFIVDVNDYHSLTKLKDRMYNIKKDWYQAE